MLSVFLGEFYRLSASRRALCLLAGCLLSAASNLARTSLLACVAALAWLALTPPLARPRRPRPPPRRLPHPLVPRPFTSRAPSTSPTVQTPDRPAPSLNVGTAPAVPTRLALALGAWVALVEIATQAWYRSHERPANASPKLVPRRCPSNPPVPAPGTLPRDSPPIPRR